MSPIPVAENFQLTTQKKVRSAGHWSLLSRDVVEQTIASLEKSGATTQSTVNVVPLVDDPSSFDRAFHEFLITELVQRGWQVVTPANKAMLTLSYQTQIIKHTSQRPNFIPGKFTAITAGLYALYNIAPAVAALGIIGGLDAEASMYSGGPTATELLLTTTVTNANRYVSRKTDVYYVEESDASLFASLQNDLSSLKAKPMKVVAE